jgi:8-oxo-dGTP diphosphatase/2-hydroxy-dATP diphosphatase
VIRAVQGSVCFVCDGDRVLLLYRNHQPFMGKWDGLTGLVEFGETPEQTARREVLEESGLTITECDHRGHLLLYNVENTSVIAADLFVASRFEGELRDSEEGLPVWVPVSEIPQVDLIGFVHVTLPLVLVPHTFLIGTIQHRSGGEIVSYELRHHQIGETQVLVSG